MAEEKSNEQRLEEVRELQKRLSELSQVAEKLKASEEALKLDEARLEALLKLSQMREESDQEIAKFALEEGIRLTGSEVGWMGGWTGTLDEKRGIVNLYTYSDRTARECNVLGLPHSYAIEGGGLWAEPIRLRKPVIINDFQAPHPSKKGFPKGHITLRNLLGVPVFDGDRIVAIAEVGNKPAGYDHTDVRQLSLLMDGLWKIMLRKRAENELIEARKQAEFYVDLMAHDINNMNQLAIGFLDMAVSEIDASGNLRQSNRYLLEKPLETLQNSARLISNVKNLQSARKGGLKHTIIDLNQVLTEVVKEYSEIPGRDVTVNFEQEPGFFVKANELIKDVFTNIVGNSVKHSRPDMPLIVTVTMIKVKEQNKDFNVVMVEDNGPGIPAAIKEWLFQGCGDRAKGPYSNGLGLGLVKTLVDDYGGKVWVEDRVAGDYTQGCRFIVKLPAVL